MKKLLASILITLLFAATASAAKRTYTTFSGKISGMANDKDHKKKRFWEYRLKTPSGKVVLVHDYRYGRYRQPASQGLKEGTRQSVRGFFVHVKFKRGDAQKSQVLIVQ